jgi:ADP-heptose:LPS heptosyltransferase
LKIRTIINRYGKQLIHVVGLLLVRPFLRRSPGLKHPEQFQPKRILYVTLAFRGDFILCFPAIRALKKRYPDAQITCWVRPYNLSLIRFNPDIHDAISYDSYSPHGSMLFRELLSLRRHREFLATFKSRRFDLMVDDSGVGFSSLVGFLAHVPCRIGRNAQGYGFLLHREAPYNGNEQLVEMRLKLLCPLGILATGPEDLVPRIEIKKQELQHLLSRVGLDDLNRGYFTVQPYGGWEAKNWSESKFRRVVEEFGTKTGWTPVFVGGDQDVPRIAQIVTGAAVDCRVLAGKLELADTVILVSGARMHIGVDSIGSHVAAAVGVKCLTLFGPTNPRISAALNKRNIAVTVRISCSPAPAKQYCSRDAGRSCPRIECMERLGTEEVLRVLTEFWKGEEQSALIEF